MQFVMEKEWQLPHGLMVGGLLYLRPNGPEQGAEAALAPRQRRREEDGDTGCEQLRVRGEDAAVRLAPQLHLGPQPLPGPHQGQHLPHPAHGVAVEAAARPGLDQHRNTSIYSNSKVCLCL